MFFFFNDTATTEIYTLSLHDALPISAVEWRRSPAISSLGEMLEGDDHSQSLTVSSSRFGAHPSLGLGQRSEEHTSELQSHLNLVCRLLLEKKKHSRAEAECHWRYLIS